MADCELKVVNMIKAIISSYNDGLKIEDLGAQYEMWGHGLIPYLKFGYNSLFDFLRAYPEIKTVKNANDESVFIVKETSRSTSNYFISEFGRKNFRKDRRFMPYRKTRNIMTRRTVTPENSDYADSFGPTNSFRTSSSLRSYSSSRTSHNSRKSSPDITIDPHKSTVNVREPVLGDQQLIGDDFFLQIAIKTLDSKLWRKSPKSALRCGLTISGQTIRDCTRRLKKIRTIGDKVTIMLGSVDIYQGRSFEEMQHDYLKLLNTLEEDFGLSKKQITIGTIVPLANLSLMTQYDECSTLLCFNNWLRQLINLKYDDFGQRKFYYNLIDFHKEFLTDIEGTNFDYFQEEARNVSGVKHGYVLFNQKGRSKAVSLFFTQPKSHVDISWN